MALSNPGNVPPRHVAVRMGNIYRPPTRLQSADPCGAVDEFALMHTTTTDPLTDRLQMVSPLARALFHHLADDAAQRRVEKEYHRQVWYPYQTAERRELEEHKLLRLLDERGLFELADSRDFARLVSVEQPDRPKRSGKHNPPKLPQVEKPSQRYEMDRWLMTRGLGSTLGKR